MYRQSEKNLLNGNISSMCSDNMLNFGRLTAKICWRVSGTHANFNGFRVLASSLQRRRLTEVNQTLHDVWPSLALRLCTTLEQRPSAKLCGLVIEMELRNFRRGRHLYLAGRPSRWASAHILVVFWGRVPRLYTKVSGLFPWAQWGLPSPDADPQNPYL